MRGKTPVPRHLERHRFFYIALLLGVGAGISAAFFNRILSFEIGGDVFFAAYLLLVLVFALRVTRTELRKAATVEDEGIALIVSITLLASGFSLSSLVLLLNGGQADMAQLSLAIASAPLSWTMLHAIMAFRYAHLFYKPGPKGRKHCEGLEFPGEGEPEIWDFVYFSFVIGMTAQTSDVCVASTAMRRTVLGHSIAAFFLNTVLIALSVNIAVVLAQAN